MIHLQFNTPGWNEALSRLPDGALIKLVDMVQTAVEVKATNPRLKVLLRHVENSGYVWSTDWSANVAQAEKEYLTYIDGTFEQYAHLVDYVEEPRNEYVDDGSAGRGELESRVMWARACAYVWKTVFQPRWPHIKALIGAQPVGNNIPMGFFKAARDYGAGISTHAYVHFSSPGVRDPLDFRYHSGRWAFDDDAARAAGYNVPIAITETGPYAGVVDGWKSAKVLSGSEAGYVATMEAAINDWKTTNAYRTGRLLGFNLFTTIQDNDEGWRWYATNQPVLNRLADMVKRVWTPVTAPPPPPPPPGGNTMRVKGVDVSHWQGVINWQQMADRGVKFAFIKLTESTGWIDPRGGANLDGAEDAGILRGGYHFYRPLANAVAQANHFCDVLEQAGPLELPPVIDLEIRDGAGPALAGAVRQFAQIVEQRVGRKPIIYTNRYYANDYLRGLGDYDLWHAQYTSASNPTISDIWQTWRFWQYTSDGDGRYYGAGSARLDLNWFNGDEAALLAYAGTAPPPPPPSDTFTLRTPYNLRNAPNTSAGTKIITLPAGTQLRVIGEAQGEVVNGSGRWLLVAAYVHEGAQG